MGKCSLIEGEWSPYCFLGAELSLLWAHYHFRLAFVHFIKLPEKSWHGSDPPKTVETVETVETVKTEDLKKSIGNSITQ